MSATIKQSVIVQSGGVVQVSSPELHEGDQAEVTIVVTQAGTSEAENGGVERFRRFAGIFSSKNSHAGDNDRIDVDLSREYGRAGGIHKAIDALVSALRLEQLARRR